MQISEDNIDFNPEDWVDYNEQFSKIFPSQKDSVKLVTATVRGRVIALGSMWIENRHGSTDEIDSKKIIGHIKKIKIDPQYKLRVQIIRRMIHALEGLAWVNSCTDTLIVHGTFDDEIIEEMDYCLIKKNKLSYYFKTRNVNMFYDSGMA